MRTYKLTNDLEISRIAYGTWRLGASQSSETQQTLPSLLIKTAYEQHINLIDLADIYGMGKSDEAVGYALKSNPGLRSKLILQEKVGIILGKDPNFSPPNRYDFSYNHLVKSVTTSLKRLGVNYVDILLLHRPDLLVEYEDVAKAFSYFETHGMVRYFGVSNHNAAQIALLQKHIDQKIIINQLNLSLLHNGLIASGTAVNMTSEYHAADGTLEYCRANNITIQAWSPLANGNIMQLPKNASQKQQNLLTLIKRIASEKQCPPNAVPLAWLLRHPACIQPIIGTQNPQRIAELAQVDHVEISRIEWYELLEAARGISVP